MPTFLRIAFLLVLAAAVAATGPVVSPAADGGSDEQAEKAEKAENKDEPRKFTNDDLGQPEGKRSASATERQPAEDSAADPLKTFRDADERLLWAQRQMADIREEIAALEQRIEYWEARKLAIRNPLLPRRVVPEDQRDDSVEDPLDGLETTEKLDRIEEIVAGLHEKIEAGRERLLKMEEELRNPRPEAPAPKPGTEPGRHLVPEPTS